MFGRHGLRGGLAWLAATLLAAPAFAAPPQTLVVTRSSDKGPVSIGVLLRGKGPLVILVPSLGRGAHDFDDLGGRLARAGYRVAAIDPRGVGESRGPMAGLTLWDYADDVAAVAKALSPEPAVLVGHAFGNRVVRATAVRRPDIVSRLVLLGAGGQVGPREEVSRALSDVFDTSLPASAHLDAVRTAFFAPNHDPSVWSGGWYAEVATAQSAAGGATPTATWASGGQAPILVVQGANDAVAPPANGLELLRTYPDRVKVATVPRAGHAMLPEQPKAIANLLISYLKGAEK